MRLGLFFGSSTGATAWAAQLLRAELGEDLVTSFGDIRDLSAAELADFDVLVLGAPTWFVGELQEDWQARLIELERLDLSHTRVALFGLGDARGYPGTFLDGLGELRAALTARGARCDLGHWPAEGYEFDASRALLGSGNGKTFCGLALDVENEGWLTAPRARSWCRQLRRELGLGRRARRVRRLGLPASPVRLRR
ncbi:MAG: flavodoxin [Planctomycetota bacterium]|nr:MAG: flavodoxin [Planctomycetota bacterium]